MVDALSEYDRAIEALIAYDEANDPKRAALLRSLFASQRVFFHHLGEAMSTNTQQVTSLAERVQGHISAQLLTLMDRQMELLTRISVQDAMLKATHDGTIDIARMLKARQQSVGYRIPPPGHDDPSEDHP